MRTIYKYPALLEDYFEVTMPVGARILTVQIQYGEPQMWALVNPSFQNKIYRFRLVGTGHPIQDNEELSYIDTFQMMNGGLVLHLFLDTTLLLENGKKLEGLPFTDPLEDEDSYGADTGAYIDPELGW